MSFDIISQHPGLILVIMWYSVSLGSHPAPRHTALSSSPLALAEIVGPSFPASCPSEVKSLWTDTAPAESLTPLSLPGAALFPDLLRVFILCVDVVLSLRYPSRNLLYLSNKLSAGQLHLV